MGRRHWSHYRSITSYIDQDNQPLDTSSPELIYRTLQEVLEFRTFSKMSHNSDPVIVYRGQSESHFSNYIFLKIRKYQVIFKSEKSTKSADSTEFI